MRIDRGMREWGVRRRMSGLCIWRSRLGKEGVVWGYEV